MTSISPSNQLELFPPEEEKALPVVFSPSLLHTDQEMVFLPLSDQLVELGTERVNDDFFLWVPPRMPDPVVLERRAATQEKPSYGPPSHHRWPTVKSHRPK